MPGRIRAHAALAGLLITLTVAGIQAVGPGVGWAQPAQSPASLAGPTHLDAQDLN